MSNMSMNSDQNAPLMALRLRSSMERVAAFAASSSAVNAAMAAPRSVDFVGVIVAAATSAAGRGAFRLEGPDRLAGDTESGQRQRRPAVDRGLHQHGADLLARHAIAQCAFDMGGELVMLAHCGQHRDVEH